MGILSRIRGFFSSCIRSSTSSSSSNEESSSWLGSNQSSQNNFSRHVPSTSVNYGRSNRVRNRINNASIIHRENFDSLSRNVPRPVVSSTKANLNYGTIRNNVGAEMTIQRIDESNGLNTCVFLLHVDGVWGGKSTHGSYKLGILSSGDNEVIQKKRMVSRIGKSYFEITVRGQQPWSKEVAFTLNGQPVLNSQKIEVLDKLKEICHKALKDGKYRSIPDFIEFYDSRVLIPLSVGDDDGKFLPYDDDNCELLPGFNEILCRDTKPDEILGSGSAHINNIARVLKLKDRLIFHKTQADNIVIDLSNVPLNFRHICKAVVNHLLRGLYYRRKASNAAAVRMEWKNRITTIGKFLGTRQSVRICKIFRDYFGILMNRYNREACDELFAFFNFHREVCEVDLHGLYVADEKKLELLRVDLMQGMANHEEIDEILQKCQSFNGRSNQVIKYELLNGKLPAHEVKDFVAFCRGRGTNQKKLKMLEKNLLRRVERSKEVDNIIEKFRSESDEAIRKLEKTLENYDIGKAVTNNTPWLEIIVGAGHHSKKKEQNIRPKVEKLLKERDLKFAPVNKGSLVVTFLKYSGPEPCFGQYYCEKCDCRWKSNQSYVEDYQKCNHCQDYCWPLKQREKEKVEHYYRL